MEGELIVIMSFLTLMVVIVLSFGTLAGKRSREHKLQRLEIEARIAEAKAASPDLARSDIEDRLRVLERIVTDPANNLSQQIEDLRDEIEETK